MARPHPPRGARPHRRQTLVVCAVVGVALLSCVAINLGQVITPPLDPQIAGLLARPESQLTYPDATLLRVNTRARIPGDFGIPYSSVWRLFGIPAAQAARVTPDMLFGWYGQQLTPRGWTILPGGTGITGFFSAERDWTNGGYRLFLGIYLESEVTRLMPWIDQTVYPIVFEAQLADFSGKP